MEAASRRPRQSPRPRRRLPPRSRHRPKHRVNRRTRNRRPRQTKCSRSRVRRRPLQTPTPTLLAGLSPPEPTARRGVVPEPISLGRVLGKAECNPPPIIPECPLQAIPMARSVAIKEPWPPPVVETALAWGWRECPEWVGREARLGEARTPPPVSSLHRKG